MPEYVGQVRRERCFRVQCSVFWKIKNEWMEVAVRRQSLFLLLEEGEPSRALQIIVECAAVHSKQGAANVNFRKISARKTI